MPIDWSDVNTAAKEAAGSWRRIRSFAWHRACRLSDPDAWLIYYTSHRDSDDRVKATEAAINERLKPFADGSDPDVVFERHHHWAVNYIDGFSLRVIRPDGSITDAFREFCRIMASLQANPILPAPLDKFEADVPITRLGIPP